MLTNFSSLKGITNSWIIVGVTRCLGSSTLGFLCYCFSQVTVFCILSCCLCWGGVCLTIINTACYFLKCTSQLQKVLGTKAWLLTHVNCCSFCCREISPFLLLFSSFYWWCSIRDPMSTLLKSMRTNQRNREGQRCSDCRDSQHSFWPKEKYNIWNICPPASLWICQSRTLNLKLYGKGKTKHIQ